MERKIVEGNRVYDEAIHSLSQVAYYIGKEIILFQKHFDLYSLFVKVRTYMKEKLYHDEISCGEILFCISSMVRNLHLISSLVRTLLFIIKKTKPNGRNVTPPTPFLGWMSL